MQIQANLPGTQHPLQLLACRTQNGPKHTAQTLIGDAPECLTPQTEQRPHSAVAGASKSGNSLPWSSFVRACPGIGFSRMGSRAVGDGGFGLAFASGGALNFGGGLDGADPRSAPPAGGTPHGTEASLRIQ